jgi:outer membrane lipoprotein LolB
MLMLLGLSGCANWPGFKAESRALKIEIDTAPAAFRLEGRVSVNAGEESFSGGLVWLRDAREEELLLRTPLGQGVAEIHGGPHGMELKNAEGRRYFAADADTLVREALGLELPLRGLAWWVVGQPRPEAGYRALPDGDGRLGELAQDGWRIVFSRYALQGGRWLPGKLSARRGDDLEVRIVIDAWELP